MKKISDKGRRLLGKIYRGLGVTAAALVLQACYGSPYDMEDEVTIRGKVQCDETKNSIPGINVAVQDMESYDRTDKDGYYYLHLPKQDEYVIEFKDVDGEYNGGHFKTETKTVTVTDTFISLDVSLEKHQ